MTTRIIVFRRFDEVWPVSADRLKELLDPIDDVELIRVGDTPPAGNPSVDRLFWLGAEVSAAQLDQYPSLATMFATTSYRNYEAIAPYLAARDIHQLKQPSEGYWGQSVAEFALGLTIAGLRQLTLRARQTVDAPERAWKYNAEQLSDDTRFTSGTIAGKRVRIVGAGNIASRYASFVSHLGADTVAWDPFAPEPSFHRSGARRELHLSKLAREAEIFVPMVPLLPSTEGLVTAELIQSLPTGTLVVLATRAGICDVEALRERVLAGELSLAADVFDVEPLPVDDPLLSVENVVATPHIAGRTLDSGYAWALALAEQFLDFDHSSAQDPRRLWR